MSKLEKVLIAINAFVYLLLAIFSYAYVDLNLTFSQNPIALKFVQNMQQLGFYHRLQATTIYLIWVIFAFSLFCFNLWLFYKSKIGKKYLAISTLINTLILIFAYPFLSSDLFNYMFDAKIIWKYHLSPYTHKALDFPQDDWIRFMRWTHRYSPYGPLWLLFSLVPTILGFGKFIVTFFAFKMFIGTFHIINAYLIYKILQKINSSLSIFGTAFYALNPLFLIEGVANAHNDIVLATFLLFSIYFLAYKKTPLAYFSILVGTLVKYIPIFNLPWLMLATIFPKEIKWSIISNLITMSIFTYVFSSFRITLPFVSSGSTQVQFQPWYLFWTIPLVTLIPKIELISVAVALSFGASLRYLPYLLNGDWSQPGTIGFMKLITLIPPVVAIIFVILKKSLFR